MPRSGKCDFATENRVGARLPVGDRYARLETTAAAAPPPTHEIEDLFRDLHWHQRWEVYRGVYTPGRNDVRELCDKAGVPSDLCGRRVLDIGAWHGCFSFECARRGAEEVVAMSVEPPSQVGFDRLRRATGAANVSYKQGSVYALDAAELGKFDLVLFFGVIYHLRHPMLAIDRLHRVAAGPVLVETHVIDNCLIPAGKTSDEGIPLSHANRCLLDIPLWQFYRTDELAGDSSNWFGPNIAAVLSAFGSAGFQIELLQQWGTRASFHATPRDVPEYMQLNCYERNFATDAVTLGRATDQGAR